MIRLAFLFLTLLIALPAYAAPTFEQIVNGPNGIVAFVDGAVIPLLYIIAFLFFLFGIFRYFFTGGEENRQKGRAFVLWSLIGMIVLFGVWGIVRLLLSFIPVG